MDDEQILALFRERDERAVAALREKYEPLCMTVAYNLLGSREDAEECFNDALLHLWEAIPPAKPESLGAYFLTAVRNAARNRLSMETAQRRGGGQLTAAIEEFSELLPSAEQPDRMIDSIAVRDALRRFLPTLSPAARQMFLRRYWLCLSVREIAEDAGCTAARVNMSLSRTRKKLKAFLEKEERL